jgi:hypothetical protein
MGGVFGRLGGAAKRVVAGDVGAAWEQGGF